METEQNIFKKSRESREVSYESKEKETDPELAAAATMERADFLVKEVKNTQTQMQNIILHINQVRQAIQQIYQQLQLQASDDNTSVEQDEERIKKLKEKIAEYKNELVNMRDDLIISQIEELKKTLPDLSEGALRLKAEEMVRELLDVDSIT